LATKEQTSWRLRETLERNYRIEISSRGQGYVRERLHETNRTAVLCVSERYGAPGEALALLRETPSSVERLLVLAGGKLTRPLRERLIPSESNAVTHDRTDVDFVLLDDHQLLVGGTRSLQRL